MAVLETLYLLFKSDTSDLKKGSDEAINSTKKLNDSLHSIDKTSEKIGTKFLGIASSFAALIASIVSINSLMSGIKNTVSYDINLGKQSRILGVNPEELDIWSNAVVHAGGSAEDFQNSLKSLADHFHTTASVALKSLPQLADVFSHISRYAAFNYGKAIGLSEPMILLLQQGRREVEALLKQQKDLGVVTEEDTKISTAYNQELQNLSHSFRTLYNALVIPVLPGLTKFFQIIEKGLSYLTNHKDLLIGAFVGIGAAAISAAIAFIPLTAEFALISIAVILLIGLFALFWEDYIVYMNKGKSLIGEFKKEWEDLSNLINETLDSWIKKLLKFLDKFGLLKDTANNIKEIQEAKKQKLNTADFLSKYNLFEVALASNSKEPINNRSSNGTFYESAFNRNLTINTGDIVNNIQSNDAEGISKEIGLKFSDHFALAMNNFGDGRSA